MFKVLTLNNISKKGLHHLPHDFIVGDKIADPDAILVRSANMHDMEIPPTVKFIGRAGAGTNNIPIEKCSEEGIVVCNTPGANANAVKELVATGLFLASRKVLDGIEWVKELDTPEEGVAKAVEKNKSQFAGPEILGKKLGIIGLGAIGVLVANMAVDLGMEVYGFDPYISIDNAWGLSSKVKRAKSVDDIISKSDYVTLHIPYMEETKNYISEDLLSKAKPGLKLLNFARGGLVNDEALIKSLNDGVVSTYVTDFPNEDLIGVDGVIAIPHLGASTPESEENCAEMIVQEMVAYLTQGNIINSVNYPNTDIGPIESVSRITINHHNVPNMIAQITRILAEDNINIANLTNTNNGKYAYTIIDTDSPISLDLKKDLYKIEGITRVRIIK